MEAADADSAQYNQSTYELLFGLGDDSQLPRSTFFIDPTSGLLSAIRPVDRETKSSFTLKVIARNTVAGKLINKKSSFCIICSTFTQFIYCSVFCYYFLMYFFIRHTRVDRRSNRTCDYKGHK